MPFERGIHEVKGEPRWDGIAVLEAQGRIELKHHLSRKSRAVLIAIIMEQQEAIGDVYGTLLEAEQTAGAWKEAEIRRGHLNTKVLDNRLMDIRTAMARCERSMREAEGSR